MFILAIKTQGTAISSPSEIAEFMRQVAMILLGGGAKGGALSPDNGQIVAQFALIPDDTDVAVADFRQDVPNPKLPVS